MLIEHDPDIYKLSEEQKEEVVQRHKRMVEGITKSYTHSEMLEMVKSSHK